MFKRGTIIVEIIYNKHKKYVILMAPPLTEKDELFEINSTPENNIIIIPIKFNILINLNTYFDFVYISGKVTNNIYKNKQDEIIINWIKSSLFKNVAILIIVGVIFPIDNALKTTTKTQSIVLHISIIEYILFSIKLILFLKKYAKHNNKEKSIA